MALNNALIRPRPGGYEPLPQPAGSPLTDREARYYAKHGLRATISILCRTHSITRKEALQRILMAKGPHHQLSSATP